MATRRSSSTARRKRSAASATPHDGLVIYIHGIGNHPPKAALKLEWDLALFGSDRGVDTRMAHWSDILHPPAPKRGKRVAAATRESDLDLSVPGILESAGVDPNDERARAFVESLLSQYGPGPSEPARGPRAKLLPLPGFMRRPISRAFLKAFVGDSAAYFFDAAVKRRIRERLLAELPADDRVPVTIVAHSQGTVVAVEVLSHLRTPLNVVKLVTLGSPLGVTEIQDLLDVPPKKRPFIIPRVVERWHNFADALDPVALDKSLRGEFVPHGEPGASPLSIPISDDLIRNERTRAIVGFNPHSAVGYLAHPKVRNSVYEAAQYDARARFVVARDVAEGLASEERQPLLIEVLEPGYHALGEDADQRDAREAAERRALRPRAKRVQAAGDTPDTPLLLADRIARASRDVEKLVADLAKEEGSTPERAVAAARVDVLRRYVAAHLTPREIREVARQHQSFNVYALWKSATKKKLISRSRSVLQADAAFESYGARGEGVRWAVLDTGVRSDHPHFRGRIDAIWDCTKPGRPVRLNADRDRDGHGSHVAGIIAGSTTARDKTVRAMAPDAKLVVYKVLNDRGEGEDAWIIKALDHIAEENENKPTLAVHGVNLSLGGPYDATVYGCGFTPICQELRRLWRSGVLVVVACGNEGQLEVQTRDGDVEINTPMSIGDPANLEDCIAVGSVNADHPHLYGVSSFSSRGPTSDGRMKPDVVAPGERIWSVNSRFNGERTWYRFESGTSMAAPHVSGMLAAFLSVRREFRGRPDEVKRILLDTCTDIARDRNHQGRGIPNLMKMLLGV